MKKINVEGGGFPGTSRTWRHIAEMVEQVALAFSKVVGTNAIIEGIEITSGNATEGFVIIDGEIYPFDAGAVGTHVEIYEDIDQVQYLKDEDNDGSGDLIDTYFDRRARFTDTATGNIPFSDFARLSRYVELSKRIPPLNTCLPYYGLMSQIPEGWQLCDGSNGTPDLRGQFVVGYDGNSDDYDAIGNTGGEDKHALTESEMPQHKHSGTTSFGGSHSHGYKDSYYIESFDNPDFEHEFVGNGKKGSSDTDNDNNKIWYRNSNTDFGNSGHSHSCNTDYAGLSQGHENRPPYFVMAWITYVG